MASVYTPAPSFGVLWAKDGFAIGGTTASLAKIWIIQSEFDPINPNVGNGTIGINTNTTPDKTLWIKSQGNYYPVLTRNFLKQGTSAPAITPEYVGQQFIDTSAKKVYVATGTSSSLDWTILN